MEEVKEEAVAVDATPEEVATPADVAEGEVLNAPVEAAPALTLTPQQMAADVEGRNIEFNKRFQEICKEFQFAITVVKKELPNGFIYEPQLMDTKFLPDQAVHPTAAAAPKVEIAPEAVTPA